MTEPRQRPVRQSGVRMGGVSPGGWCYLCKTAHFVGEPCIFPTPYEWNEKLRRYERRGRGECP
jgi:hypothetical protein